MAWNYYKKTTYSYCIPTTLETRVAKAPLESPLSNCHVISVKCKCLEAHSTGGALHRAPRRQPPVTGLSRHPSSFPHPPSPGRGHCGRCCFRWFSKQTCLSQFLIIKPKIHTRFLSEHRTCFWLILKPLFIWRWWVSASVCGLSAGGAGFSDEVHALFSL